jgi:hypothetical protein
MAEDSPKSGEGNHVPAAEPVESSELRRVFISYASQDAAIANAVVTALERAGISCWIAPRDVTPGALYADGIIRAINDAKALVLVLSASSIGSPHVGKEVGVVEAPTDRYDKGGHGAVDDGARVFFERVSVD